MEKVRDQLRVKKERAILVAAIKRGPEGYKSDNLTELTALAETAGAEVVDRFQQKILRIHAPTYIGSGKAHMLADRVKKHKADVIIFDNDLSPGQIRELEKIAEAKVLDRSELILDIFATRAMTRQAKLQVELAQLEYTYPRLTRMWSHLDTVAGAGGATAAGAVGGIGTRGTGEKQLEIDRRLVSRRITELKRELVSIDRRKLREIGGRRGHFKICLVGYTNAGKSTLMKRLTGADVFIEDRLFATLDTRTRKWSLDGSAQVLLSDTVGFISNLPHHLVASFKATLEEAVNADLLLHVVDAGNDSAFEQIKSVNAVLKEIECDKKDILVVLNKCDAIRQRTTLDSLQTIYPDAVCLSARTGMNIDALTDAVLSRFHGGQAEIRVTFRAGNGKVQSFLRANGTILEENYIDSMVHIIARLGTSRLSLLKRLQPVSVELVK
ncbi:MAG: GTPase HflX [Sedimentisphaerales bacterium]|nr:GTPase HflX [Sedimentisphaerales bacterium]